MALTRGPLTEPQSISGGVAAGDFDRDGWPDLYVVRGNLGPNLLFRNRGGDGAFVFEEVGESAGLAISGSGVGPTFGDLDGDGWLDLVIGGIDGDSPRLFRNLRDGTFEEITASAGIFSSRDTFSVALGDYDLDGDLDLFLSHWAPPPGDPIGAPHLWRNNGGDPLTFSPADFSAGIATAFMERDWSFTPTFTDFDDDGGPDLLVAGDFGTSLVFRNLGPDAGGTVTFENLTGPVISDENGMGAAVGDFDNDGDLDWFVSSIWDPDGIPEGNWGVTGNRLYRNLGDFELEDATDEAGVRFGFWGWGSCFADFDNDGWLDLFHTNGFQVPAAVDFLEDPARMFISDGGGTFVERSAELGVDHPGQGRGVVCFDYDRDGDVDLFVANNSGPPLLYRNDGGNELGYFQLRLRGTGANSEAIGARVSIQAGSSKQLREMRAGSNFVSQNPVEAHFGLGQAERIDELRIVWPDGEVQMLTDLEADQRLVIEQGFEPRAIDVPVLGAAGLILLALSILIAGISKLRRSRSGSES